MAKKSKKGLSLSPKEREHLEECVESIKRFLQVFHQFYWSFRHSFQGEPITMDVEFKFLQLKSEVARNHQFLYDQLGQLYIEGAVITDLLRKIVTLEKISKTQPENYYKIEGFWHRHYLNLQDTLASIQFRLDQEEHTT